MANNFRCLLGVVGLITLFNLVVSEEIKSKVLQCVLCQGRLSLLDCDQIQTCDQEEEICFVEEVIDLGGQVVINAGCRKQHECDSRGCFNDVTRKRRDIGVPRPRRSSTGEEICHHCCDTNLCNMYGCSNTNDIDNLKGSRCLACNVTEHPSRCSYIQTCDAGEFCLTTMMVRNTGALIEKRYKTGCMKDQICAVLDKMHNESDKTDVRKKRAFVDVYSECCKDHLCNRDIPLASDAPQRQSKKYTCPDRNTTAVTDSNPDEAMSGGVCEDRVDNCAEYGADYICHGDYIPWAKLNCNKFCKFCEPCEDKIAECSEYGYEYICNGDYIPWSLLNCQHFCNLCSVTTPAPASTTAVTTKPTTPAPNVCEDKNNECALYGSDYICHGEYIPWSLLNCKQFCNLCNYVETTSVTTTQASTTTEKYVCRDVVDNCAEYGYEYICFGDYIPWSQINCQLFCGFCSATTDPPTTKALTTEENTPAKTDPATTKALTTEVTSTKYVCHDKVDNCADYGREYICFGDYIPWSKINCPVFCGLCEVETTTVLTTLGHTTEEVTSPRTTETITTLPSTTRTPVHTSSTTDPNVCEDKIDECPLYGSEYICHGDYIPWSMLNCKKFCNFCKNAETTQVTSTHATSTKYVCHDEVDNCADYGREYICYGDYIPWSKINCPVFCGFCAVETTSQLMTSTPIQTTEAITTVPSTTPKPVHSTSTRGTSAVTSSELPKTSPQSPESTTGIPVTSTLAPITRTTTQVVIETDPTTKATTTSTASSLATHTTEAVTTEEQTTTVETTTVLTTLGHTTEQVTSPRTTEKITTLPSTTRIPVHTSLHTSLHTSSTTDPNVCEDKIDECPLYGSEYICHGDYIPWSMLNCKKFCNFCKNAETTQVTSTQATSTKYVCRDEVDNCADYGREYICFGDYIPWSKINCPVFCGFCAVETTTQLMTSTPIQTTEAITTVPSTTPKPVHSTSTRGTSAVTSSELPKTSPQSPESTTGIPVTSTLAPITRTTRQVVIETDPTTKATTTSTASSLATHTTEAVTTEEQTTTERPCRDTLDCSVYSVKLACQGNFLSWAQEHCPKYCGFCIDESDTTTTTETTTISTTPTTTRPTTTVTTTTTPAPTTTPEDPNCKDVAQCAGLEHKCDDPTQHHWLYENCKHTCAMCKEVPDCEDEIHDCAALAVLVCDLGLNPELKPKCKKTCKLC